jgi:hypothetical protein
MLIAIDHFANYSLLGGLEHEFYDFPYVGNVIIPTENSYVSDGLKPPTSYNSARNL